MPENEIEESKGEKEDKKNKKVKKKEDYLVEIKKNLTQKKIIIGAKKTVKNIKLGRIKKIFLSSNCPRDIRKDIKYYSKISKFDIIELDYKNDELGIICKKPFSIAVLGIAK